VSIQSRRAGPRSDLVEHDAVRVRHLLHHSLLRQQACERGAAKAPMLPGIVWPILLVCALGSRRVEGEGIEQLRILPRWISSSEGVVLFAFGKTRQRVWFAGIRAFPRYAPSYHETRSRCACHRANSPRK